jgi:hypothetical protein
MRVLLGLAMTAAVIVSIPSAHAEEWCGFLDKEHSQVHCGYSSLAECKQSIGDKDAICIPDPNFAANAHVKSARS